MRSTLIAIATAVPIVFAAPAHAAVDLDQLQGEVVFLTNKERARHDCPAVRVDARLTEASSAHSAYMAHTRAFGHTEGNGGDFIARARAAHYPHPLSENIAFGFRTGVDVVQAWMDSPLHRANLLNCQATAVGVGAVLAADGTPYITPDFGD